MVIRNVAARSSSLPEMKGVQLDVGRVDMTLCKNASNRDMQRVLLAQCHCSRNGRDED